MRQSGFRQYHSQKGAVLIIAVIFLTLTALISSSVMNTSVLESKMVGNAQFKEEAFQVAEGVVDAIVADYKDSLPVTGDIGYTVCETGDTYADCNSFPVDVPAAVTADVPASVDLTYRAERLGPLTAPLPFRQSETSASSAGAFNVAIYEVEAEFDGRDAKLGHHKVHQGIAIRVAAAGQ